MATAQSAVISRYPGSVLRGSFVLALVIAWLAIGCGSPTSTVMSSSGAAPDAVIADDDAGVGTIMIVPSEIELAGPAGTPVSMPYSINGMGTSTHVSSMTWSDSSNAFDSTDPTCLTGTCPFGTPGFVLPKAGTLTCTPSAMERSATLQVTSNTGAIGTAFVTCKVAAMGPSFAVPSSVGRVAAPVNGSVPAALIVTNNGGEELMITVSLVGAPNASHWKADECTTNACPLPVGQSISIDLAFEPTEHGELDSTIEVFGPPALGSQTVQLLGTGVGGKLRVDEPSGPAFQLDFGTIARNQLVTLPVEMSNTGNANLDVTPSNPGAPFTIPTTPVTITEGSQGQFGVSCMSGTAMPVQTETVTLTTDAYQQNTPSVEVRCAIADTTVQVTSPLDFGELRVGDDTGTIDVTVLNPPGNSMVTIERIALVSGTEFRALSLTAPELPATLAGGASLEATLELATTADVVLQGVSLEVEVTEDETVVLSQPVSGKVGTPAAVVLPLSLDLGSVCVGTPVDGTFTMSNTGTATLKLQRPTMSSESFVPLYTNPTDYPDDGATLLPGDKAMVGVMLATSSAGPQEATLEWNVDAPGSPFSTTVGVELLMDGTAVSPGTLRFGAIDITEPPAMNQTITLENCGPGPALVTYDRVVASDGQAGAWKLDPPSQQRELLPDETMRVRVAFDPETPGIHRGALHFSIDDGEEIVQLEGEALGTLPDETSFYACGCSGSSDPTRGWPILLAIPFVLRRRRSCCS